MSNGKNDALDSFFKAADAIKKDKVEEYEEILESFESKEEEIVETPIPQEPPVQNTTESYLQQLRGTSGPAFSSFHSKKEIKPEGDMNQYVDRVKHASTGDIYEQDLQNTPATMKDLGNLSQQIAANLQTSLTSLGGGGLGEKDVLQLIGDNVPDVELDSAQIDKVIQELQGLMLDSSEVVLKAGDTMTGPLNFDNSNFITNLPDPADDQHAATKAYVDGIPGAFNDTFLPLSGGTLLGDLILDSNNGSVSNITVKSGAVRATDGGSVASNVYNSVGNSNVSFQRNGSTGIQIVSANVRIFKEMVYASQPVIDNSDNWTSTTLVHKGYVDNAISGISVGVDSAATIDMIENTVDSAYIESRIDVVSPSSVGTTVAAARFKYSTSFSYDSAGAMPGSFVVNQFGISDIARTQAGRYTVAFDSDTAALLGGSHNYIVMTTIDYNGDNPTLSSRHIAVNGQTDDMFYLLAERSDNATDGDYNDQSFINFQVIRIN